MHRPILRLLVGTLALSAAPWVAAGGASAPATQAPARGTTERKPAMAESDPALAGKLMTLLPETLAGWQRSSIEQPLTTPERGPQPAVRARYAMAGRTAVVDVTTGVPPGTTGERKWQRRAQGSSGDQVVSVALKNGVVFSATGRGDADALEALLKAADLDSAEKLRNKR